MLIPYLENLKILSRNNQGFILFFHIHSVTLVTRQEKETLCKSIPATEWRKVQCMTKSTTIKKKEKRKKVTIQITMDLGNEFPRLLGFPGGSDGKQSACMQETQVCSVGWAVPWRREGYPLHYSCLENPMDRGAWRATAWCDWGSNTFPCFTKGC